VIVSRVTRGGSVTQDIPVASVSSTDGPLFGNVVRKMTTTMS
jgi:hypothetical protein